MNAAGVSFYSNIAQKNPRPKTSHISFKLDWLVLGKPRQRFVCRNPDAGEGRIQAVACPRPLGC